MRIIVQGKGAEHKVQAPYKVIALGLLDAGSRAPGCHDVFWDSRRSLACISVSRTSWPLALVCLRQCRVAAYGYSAGPLPLGMSGSVSL